MIVKCDKCQTRFKIPDEKVTEKGVKVRCTKCQNTFKVRKAPEANPATAPIAPPAPSSPQGDTDPFARFGLAAGPDPLEATRPGIFPEGIAATRGPSEPLTPFFGAQQDVPADVFDQPTRVAPVPQGLLDARPFDPSNPLGDRPESDFTPTAPSVPAVPPPIATPPPIPTTAGAAATAAQVLADLPDPFANGSDEPVAPGSGTFGADPSDVSSLLGEVPPAVTDEVDAFSGPLAEPDRGLFDMPPAPPPPPPGRVETEGAIAIGALRPATPPPQPAALSPSPLERPAGRPEDVGMGEAPRGTVGRAVGLVVNLALASALVLVVLTVGTIYLNEGKLDASALSLDAVKALFAPPGELFATDVSNGLYDTKSGKQIFYVRGEVENRGETSLRARVRVEILDGADVLMSGEVLAGASPSPEALYNVTSAKALQALTAGLDEKAAAVAPGRRVPFLVAFYDYPPQLSEYRLKVSVQQAPAGKTAAAP